jgi:hypothetical protein
MFLAAFLARAGRGPWLAAAAGDEELVLDMPCMLPILATLHPEIKGARTGRHHPSRMKPEGTRSEIL